MTTEKVIKDVAIIGAGPVGLFAIFECGMLGFSAHVIDSLPEIGGQCTALYPEKPIYDIPGFPSVQAEDLIHNLEAQAAPFDPQYHLGQQVQNVTRDNDGIWSIETSKDICLYARSIIIAAGAGAFGPNRPPLAGIEDYEEHSVFYAVRDKEKFRDKNVVIAGGGDSAIDWALSLQGIAAQITLVHRRDKFRAAPEMVAQVKELAASGKLDLATPYQLKGLSGDHGRLNGVIIADLDNNSQEIKADFLLPFYGLAADLGPLASWGINIEHHHIAVNPRNCATNVEGIYAIGDVAAYPDKLKLILTGFAEAAQAAHAVYKQLKPDVPLHVEYSTTKGIPTSKVV
jgi:thioredoxin reductase (NADPH)